MNVWIKRSLGTVAVAGGLMLAGAAAANADDGIGSHQQDSTSHSSTGFGAPIEIGGLSLGSTSEHSSSSTTSSTSTDGDRSTSHSETTGDHSSSATGIKVDPTTIDPGAMLSNGSSSHSSSTGGRDTGSDDDSSSSATNGAASAPIHLGGISVQHQQADASTDSTKDSAKDGDQWTTDEDSSADSSSSQAGFGTGGVDINPGATLDQSQHSNGSSLGDEDGIDSSESASHTSGAASAPITVEGLTGSYATESHSADHESTSAGDGDRSWTSTSDSTDDHGTGFAFDGAGFALAPGGAFSTEQSGSDSSLGDTTGEGNGIDSSDSASSTSLEGSAPYAFEGFTGELTNWQDTSSTESDSATDGDQEVTSTTTDADHDATTIGGQGGSAWGEPWFGFGTTQSSQSENGSTLGDDNTADGSTGSTWGGFDSPYGIDGVTGWVDQDSSADYGQTDTTWDGEDSSTDQTSSHEESDNGQDLGLDGLTGHPAGALSTDDLSDTSSNDLW
jgi:hypothetical protein